MLTVPALSFGLPATAARFAFSAAAHSFFSNASTPSRKLGGACASMAAAANNISRSALARMALFSDPQSFDVGDGVHAVQLRLHARHCIRGHGRVEEDRLVRVRIGQ